MLIREKIKIFTGDTEKSIEEKINTWLSEESIKIVRCLQSDAVALVSDGFLGRYLTISIFYEEEII